MLDDRKLAILRAIVTDYVDTREPVGSKALVERHRLDVSAATVRNDMAALEEEGYITQPHTSAGRIPTDKGYRLFVDRLAQIKPLSSAERTAIAAFLNGTADVDDLMARTVRLLAQLTRQVAIVQYPVAQRAVVRHVDLVPLTVAQDALGPDTVALAAGASAPDLMSDAAAAEALPDTGLTPRMQEIRALLRQGLSNKHIAQQLDLSEGTVKNYMSDIFRLLSVSNRTQAAQYNPDTA